MTVVLYGNRTIDIDLGRTSPHARDERIFYEGRAMSVGPIFMIVLCPGMGMQVPELGEDQLADVLIDLHGGFESGWMVVDGGGGEDHNVRSTTRPPPIYTKGVWIEKRNKFRKSN